MLKPGRTVRRLALIVLVTVMAGLSLQGQGRRFRFSAPPPDPNPLPYDGRFTIVRLWYPHYGGWSYDYPDMEQNLTLILNDLTAVRPRPDGSNILRMDDPELMKFPIAYLSEPGYWYPTDSEANGLADVSREGRVPDRGRLPLRERMATCSRPR